MGRGRALRQEKEKGKTQKPAGWPEILKKEERRKYEEFIFNVFSQAYQDCRDDYNRSVKLKNFPRWDYVILTASNDQQAEGFRRQIEERKEYLPAGTKFAAVPDRAGERVGSGGATLEVLKYLHEQEGDFRKLRVLVIHSGGDSKRVPQYSALGKLFSPVPHQLPDGRSSTLFDEFMICMSSVPSRIREGMVLLSGDVLLLFNPLQIDYNNVGAAAVSFMTVDEIGVAVGMGDANYFSRMFRKVEGSSPSEYRKQW